MKFRDSAHEPWMNAGAVEGRLDVSAQMTRGGAFVDNKREACIQDLSLFQFWAWRVKNGN
jgi:hypothetical protein